MHELGKGLAPNQVAELVTLLEAEFGIPVGLLRPEDSLQRLFAPISAGNPLKSVWAESALEDGMSEVNYRLKLRRKSRGAPDDFKLKTMRDLFVAWCGPAA